VWLAVRENVWNFPIGMANVAAFFVLFLQTRLYADAGLQVAYFFLGGWVGTCGCLGEPAARC
jgi:nicotinamide mononucleotide transporter